MRFHFGALALSATLLVSAAGAADFIDLDLDPVPVATFSADSVPQADATSDVTSSITLEPAMTAIGPAADPIYLSLTEVGQEMGGAASDGPLVDSDLNPAPLANADEADLQSLRGGELSALHAEDGLLELAGAAAVPEEADLYPWP